MPTLLNKTLETFPNPEPGRDYIIEIEAPEFTCLCPKTGQPDFATLTLEYVPDRLCVELKSLKLYIWSYRNEGAFHEKVTNTILNDLVAATQPRYMRLRARFNVRGGITTSVEVEHRQPGWTPVPPRPDHLPREVQKASSAAEETRPLPAPVRAAKAESQPAPAPAPEPEAVRPATPEPAPAVAPNPSIEAPAPASRSERFRMLRRRRSATSAASAETPVEPASPPPAPAAPARDVYIGLDFGTSGCRALAIDTAGNVLSQADTRLPPATRNGDQVTQDPMQWWKAMTLCLQNLLAEVEPQRIQRLAVAGTSGTLLLCDKHGHPLTPALMYNDRRAKAEAEAIAGVADDSSGAHGATSSLAKLLWLQGKNGRQAVAHVLHQADWISNRLMGDYGHSDYNNCLKLGYDAQAGDWPSWFAQLDVDTAPLPKVHAPGDIIGIVSAEMVKTFGLPAGTEVAAGTSDGVAAFLASGAAEPGQGMTALGNSLVLKLLCTKPVFSPAHGVYSHRLGSRWLAGGASNAGGAVLLQYFSEAQLREMTPLLDPEHATDLAYYPLPDIGERFPVNDPNMEPRLEPLPGDSVMFLQGMLEGVARIEAQGYQLLTQLGAPKVKTVRTTGGGSSNPAWTRIRERTLGIKITAARSEHAAYGSALIAAGIIAKAYL